MEYLIVIEQYILMDGYRLRAEPEPLYEQIHRGNSTIGPFRSHGSAEIALGRMMMSGRVLSAKIKECKDDNTN